MPGLNINNHSLDAAHSLDGVVVVAREPWTKWEGKAPHLASSLFII